MKRLFLLLLATAVLGTAPDPAETWRIGGVAFADDGDGGDSGDGDGGDSDSGDSDSDGDGDDGDDGDDSDDGASASSPGSSAEQGRGTSDGGGDPISELIDLIFGADRPVVPNEVLVLTPTGQAPPNLAALQAAGFAILEDTALAGLQARVLRLSTPPGADLEDAAQTVRAFSPGSTVDLNDLYEGAGSGCGDDCWAATLVALDEDGGRSCRRGAPIAVIDTGVRRDHPSLRRARIEARSFLRPGATPAPMRHGTAIAALLVGEAERVPGQLGRSVMQVTPIAEDRRISPPCDEPPARFARLSHINTQNAWRERDTGQMLGAQDMTTVSIKSNCKGVVKFFNQSRGTGLINSDDGSEFYINRRNEGDAGQFHRGLRVVFSVRIRQGKAPVIMDLRRA